MTEKEQYELLTARTSLAELIEAERENLMQVHAIARCLYGAMLYSDDDDALIYADVAKVIARLVEEGIDAFEKIVRRSKAGEFGRPPDTQ